MALHHASSGELIDMRPFEHHFETAVTKVLFKSAHLEVSCTVLLAGKVVPPHKVPGEMTVQCIEGQVELGGTHALKAIEDSSLLVTMLLHGA